MTASFSTRRLAGALGAEITGLDLAAAIDDDTFAAVRATFLEHEVICIRGQAHVTPDQQLAFAHRFGEVSSAFRARGLGRDGAGGQARRRLIGGLVRRGSAASVISWYA